MSDVAIRSDALSATIAHRGAELQTLRDADGRDLLWDGDPAFWTGRAPILFPIIGELAHHGYRLDGRTYALERHGFARRRDFALVEASDSRAVLRLTDDADTRTHYPFGFVLDIAFALDGATLSLTATIANPGGAPLPASVGFHPAFRWPLPYGAPREEHRISFEHDEPEPLAVLDADGLVTDERRRTPVAGNSFALRDRLFARDALIWPRLNSRRLRYGPPEGRALAIGFPDTPSLGIWTKPGAGYVCIEPWAGLADPQGFAGDFIDKPGIFLIPPGDARVFRMTVTLTD